MNLEKIEQWSYIVACFKIGQKFLKPNEPHEDNWLDSNADSLLKEHYKKIVVEDNDS